ncbi:MAG: phosphatidylserine decarboxylase [Alphaproteobacteria bacterium]|nr:phosphatidylserine decarboxylase [Alphaproteobacteria bacterium]
MRDALIVSALSLLPRTLTARCMGVLARTGVSRLGVRLFVRAYGVDVTEAEHDLAAYPTLEAFFTRRLRPGARPVDDAPDALVSPVDGTAAWLGTTVGGGFEVAPGMPLSVADLLGEPVDGERDVAVLYLSPKDYHRVHAPQDGTITSWRYLPGTLWPVFPAAVRSVRGLFARNERMALRGHTGDLSWDLVLVGAFGVGRIEVGVVDLLSNTGRPPAEGACDVAVARGDEVGVFHLGSTVIGVWPAGTWAWSATPGAPVRMGARLGRRRTPGA